MFLQGFRTAGGLYARGALFRVCRHLFSIPRLEISCATSVS